MKSVSDIMLNKIVQRLRDLIAGKASADHNHDGTYSASGHTHTAEAVGAATADHNHDGVYSAEDHNHDGVYSAEDHNHDGAFSALIEKLVPVGYIFQWNAVEGSDVDLSTKEKVAAHFGIGEWEQIKDKFLLSCGDNHAAGETGGEETHTLTIDEMPEHRHDLKRAKWYLDDGKEPISVLIDSYTGSFYGTTSSSTAAYKGFNEVYNNGGGKPHNNMPPYLTVYTWKRIA